MKLTTNVVYWHIEILLRFDFIHTVEFANRNIYFDSKLRDEDVKKLYFQVKEESKNILEQLKLDDSGFTIKGISKIINSHPKTVQKYLKQLESFGYVERVKTSNREVLYFYKE